MLLVSVVPGLVDAGMWDVDPDPFPVGRAERVGGMDPAVCIEDVLGDVPGVNTHDGRPDVLSSRHYEGEGQQGHHSHPVVKPKHRTVRVVSAHLDQAFQSKEQMQHFAFCSIHTL